MCYFFCNWRNKICKLYVPIVTLSTQDNTKLLHQLQLESGFKRTINWNKYESHMKTYTQNRYLNQLIDPSFQGVNRLFVLILRMKMIEHHTQLKDYNVVIDGRNFFDQPINSMTKTYENIRKIAAGQGDDYTTGCLLVYSYFKNH